MVPFVFTKKICISVCLGLILIGVSNSEAQLTLVVDSLDVSQLPLVRTKVRVLNNGSAVGGITFHDFLLYENGTLIDSLSGYCEDTLQNEALSILMIIDKSGSMRNAIESAKLAARNFVDRLSASDEMSLVSFTDRISNDQDWTYDKNLMKSKIDQLQVPFFGGGTALWDAIYFGAGRLIGRTKKKVMIVLTDGQDTDSQRSYNDALTAIRNANIIVYTIGLGQDIETTLLTNLARSTGGKYYNAPTVAQLEQIYAEISKEITSTGICELRYTSKINCLNGSTVQLFIIVDVPSYGTASQTVSFRLPLDTSSYSYVTLSIRPDYVVEGGKEITLPVELTRVSTNRPPSQFDLHIRFDRSAINLTSVQATVLSAGASIFETPEANGSFITMTNVQPIRTTGDLITLTFSTQSQFYSTQVSLQLDEATVNQPCTEKVLKQGMVTISGSCERSVIRSNNPSIPSRTEILPNVPNPFNPSTIVRYTTARNGFVTLKVYDVIGREVKTLVQLEQKPGAYEVYFDGSAMANGVYFARLQVSDETALRRILLVK